MNDPPLPTDATLILPKPGSAIGIIVIKLIFLIVFITLGIVGNCTVLISIRRYKKLQTVPNFFVFNLAVADLLFSLLGMPMILITTVCDEWVLGDFLCKLNGLLNSTFCTTSIWTLVMIGVNRYLSVARPRDIRKIYTKRKTCVIIACVWVFSFLISMPPLVGWSEFVPGSNFCTVNGKSGLSYGIMLLSMDYFVPLLTLGGLYLRIFFILRKNKATMLKSRNNSLASDSNTNTLDGNSSVTCDFTTNTVDSDSMTHGDSKFPDSRQKKLEILRIQILKMKICRKSKDRGSKDCTIPMKDAREESVVEAVEKEYESEMSVSEHHLHHDYGKQSPIPQGTLKSGHNTLTRRDTLRICEEAPIHREIIKSGSNTLTRKDILKSGQETPTRRDSLKSGQQTPARRDNLNCGQETPTCRDTLKSGQQTPIRPESPSQYGQRTPVSHEIPLKSGQQTPVSQEAIKNGAAKIARTLSHKDKSGVRRTRSLKRQRHAVAALKKFFNELDVTRMLLIVVLAFFLCWTTFMISSILYAFNIAPAEYRLMTFGIYIACLNSIINPLIYALMNRNFRHYFKELYRRKDETCSCVPV